jgi:nitrogen fixation protein FixH
MTARTKWAVAIVGLLAVNVIAAVTLAVLANRGAAQVIPDYYAKAAHYDDELARSAASQALGWRIDVMVQGGAIDAAVIDAEGRPIEGAQVRVTGYQRAHAAEPIVVALVSSGPGRYHGALAGRRGWYDLLVTVELGASRFSRRVTVEMR